jgi:hypothetical protein
MKKFASFLISIISISMLSQNSQNKFEKYPVFTECAEESISELENCFNYTLQQFVFANFKTPDVVFSENYKGNVEVFFEVDKEGSFKILYVDAFYNELKEEVKKIFGMLPKISPATYNGNPAYVQYTLPIQIPLEEPLRNDEEISLEQKRQDLLKLEYDSIEKLPYSNQEFRSNINIPLSHQNYSRFDT